MDFIENQMVTLFTVKMKALLKCKSKCLNPTQPSKNFSCETFICNI